MYGRCPDPDLAQVVLDTNIVLDMLVFGDPGTQPLKLALAARQIQWLATPAMRDELARVLGYPNIMAQLSLHQVDAERVLLLFDDQAQMAAVAPRANAVCGDPDDQKFVDLAVAHKARLLSKDRAILCMSGRLQVLGVPVQATASTGHRCAPTSTPGLRMPAGSTTALAAASIWRNKGGTSIS